MDSPLSTFPSSLDLVCGSLCLGNGLLVLSWEEMRRIKMAA